MSLYPHPNDPNTPDDYEYISPEEERNEAIDEAYAQEWK